MHLEELGIALQKVRGVGPSAQKALGEYGIRSVRDLLWHLPREYQDRGKRLGLSNAVSKPNVWVNTAAEVIGHEWFGAPPRQTLKILIDDGSAQASLVCFGRDFLARQLSVGSKILVYGQAQYRFREIQISVFEWEKYPDDQPEPSRLHDGAAIPGSPHSAFGVILGVYPLTGKLTQGFFRRVLATCIESYGRHIEEPLPPAIIERYRLIDRAQALTTLHLPETQEDIASARRRLVYEELLLLQLGVLGNTLARKGRLPDVAHETGLSASPVAEDYGRFVESLPQLAAGLARALPFELTAGQISAVREILSDLDQSWPMSRLIQGDVGSGKTLVALMAALAVIERGGQAALMVPTVLLARQHAERAASLLEPLGIRVALLAGQISAPSRRPLVEALKRGDIQLVIGTHALFGAELVYANLRLAIVDEQHRFGVSQRQALFAKAQKPNLLMMSATPIPQTLALTVFGDMDKSIVATLPAHRKPIETHLARMGNETKVYEWIRKELGKGRQAYFVYPLIEGGSDPSAENSELKNAEAMFKKLSSEIFPDYACGMIHSRMEDEAKESVMDSFYKNEMRILVATSVVEVGVDVPNATCMVIEHAERFGLAALHQLRGRVGRGSEQSYCFLVYTEPLSEESKDRLKALKESTDGFLIAEEDLRIRGPGDLKGVQQSGFFRLRIADLSRDAKVMLVARADAAAILRDDPGLDKPEHRGLSRIMHIARAETEGA